MRVTGSGPFQFEYTGYWIHGDGDIATGGTDTYSISAGDRVRMRFTGSRIRYFANCDANHGMLWISVDGGERSLVDQYTPQRVEHALQWDSGPLARGEHVWEAEVADEKNPLSRFFWLTIDRVESRRLIVEADRQIHPNATSVSMTARPRADRMARWRASGTVLQSTATWCARRRRLRSLRVRLSVA